MTNTASAKNLSAARWLVGSKVAGFQTSKAYGIVDAEGRMLSTNGAEPATWGTMAAARTIAECEGWKAGSVWIEAL